MWSEVWFKKKNKVLFEKSKFNLKKTKIVKKKLAVEIKK